MRNYTSLAALGVALLAAVVFAQEPSSHSYVPKDGFVPDAQTAIRIAEAVWIPIYGEATIARAKPFKAELRGSVWLVTGSLPPHSVGGVVLAEVAKENGCILRISHGKQAGPSGAAQQAVGPVGRTHG